MNKAERTVKIEKLFAFHNKYFTNASLKINEDFNYIPKLAHYKKGSTADDGKVMGFFESEISEKTVIYTEMIDINWNSEDPTRTLYKIEYNPFYSDEYEQDSKGRFLIPLEEMKEVKVEKVFEKRGSKSSPAEFSLVNKSAEENIEKVNDCSYSDMTLRDYAAIHTGKPVSNKEWLNKIISNN